MVLTIGVSYEVFVRYVLTAPTTWAFDISYMTYGALLLLSGPYTLSRNGHVRADVLYRLWPARVQASMDLVLYILFFFPVADIENSLSKVRAGGGIALGLRQTPGGDIVVPCDDPQGAAFALYQFA